MVNRVESTVTDVRGIRQTQGGHKGVQNAAGSFADVLAGEVAQSAGVQVTNHAERRIAQRALSLDSDAVARLGRALDRAQEKGVRSSLILLDGLALVANVPNRRIVTALETNQAKHKVFTNIDGVVFA